MAGRAHFRYLFEISKLTGNFLRSSTRLVYAQTHELERKTLLSHSKQGIAAADGG
jgi:hypothetical protein